MFRKLKIQNYILIDKVEIDFSNGFNVITGETGSGKSILLGALALISGQRIDPSVLKDKDKKCIIEAEISLQNNSLKTFFVENDLDFEQETIIRREININGKSRAFINDSPVVLRTLEKLSHFVFDIHTQDQNRLLKDDIFRLHFVDTIAKSSQELLKYQTNLKQYTDLESEVNRIAARNKKFQEELEFIEFQFQQLSDANLEVQEQELLERELEELSHSEEIKQALIVTSHLISGDENSVLSILNKIEQELQKISSYHNGSEDYLKRIKSNLIDLQDIAPDIESAAEDIEYQPDRIEFINDRLTVLNSLQQKHRVDSVEALIALRDKLDLQLSNFTDSSIEIESKQKQLKQLKSDLEKSANILSNKRKASFKFIEEETIKSINYIGIPNARFCLKHQKTGHFDTQGQDEIRFFFSANKGTELDDLNKIASGGEVSRLMLSLKQLLSKTTGLSTLILDEIDTGVSGEIANKMGKLMQKMSKNRQLIVITHLPQVAAKGDVHFKVMKNDTKKTTVSKVVELNQKNRMLEIAQLLSGENISDAAINNAKELINN